MARYDSPLVKVDRPEATRERYGSVVTIKLEPDNKYFYEDALFSGILDVSGSRINFTLTNKTDHSIKIIWDESAFIDVDGLSARVTHEGAKYSDRNASQPPSVIPARMSLTDFVVPADHIYYQEGYYLDYDKVYNIGGWKESDLVSPSSGQIVSGDSTAVQAFTLEAEKNKGKLFGFLLPLEIEGTVNEYTFWFEIHDASVYGGK